MREILFRGKRIDSGEWVYGVAFPHDNCGKVTMFRQNQGGGALEGLEVLHETVGQYTGLTDNNGTKIFEGDIVDCLEYYGEVYYDHDGCFDLRDNTSEMCGGFIGSYNSLKVVGNIHDNPELLKGKS